MRTSIPCLLFVLALTRAAGAWGASAGAAVGVSTPAVAPAVAAVSAASVAATVPSKPPVFVLNSLDASVSVLDPQTWREIKRIPTGKEPHHVYLTPDEKSLVVANAGGDALTFIDPRSAEVQRTVRNTLDPYQLRFSPDMKWLVTLGNRLNHLDIYRWDGKEPQLVKRVPSRKTPSHLWINSKSDTVYATMQDSDELIALSLATQSILWRVKTGPMPADVFGTADDRYLLVGLTGGDGVEVFDVSTGAARLVKRIKTGKGAHAFRAWGDKRHVLVSNRVANTVSKIDLQSLLVVAQYPVPSGPDCIEVSADRRFIYVTSRWAGKLSVIDAEKGQLLRQVKVGKSPHGVWTLDHAPRF